MNNRKGFVQIPILIAIIVGILVLGGSGYFGVRQYLNYQAEKVREEKIVREKEKENQTKDRDSLDNYGYNHSDFFYIYVGKNYQVKFFNL